MKYYKSEMLDRLQGQYNEFLGHKQLGIPLSYKRMRIKKLREKISMMEVAINKKHEANEILKNFDDEQILASAIWPESCECSKEIQKARDFMGEADNIWRNI